MPDDIGNPFVIEDRQARLGRALDAGSQTIDRPAPWYWSLENIRGLLGHLFETDQLGEGIGHHEKNNILYYLAKPWKWNKEWSEFLKANPKWRP